MESTPEIWVAFGQMFGMLFVVLALIMAVFYVMKRFSVRGTAGGRDLISVLGIHHLSPKEKLILVKAADQVLLIGVTPNAISKLSRLDADAIHADGMQSAPRSFSDMLAAKLTAKRSGTS